MKDSELKTCKRDSLLGTLGAFLMLVGDASLCFWMAVNAFWFGKQEKKGANE